jgi:hypothetical protein
MNTDIVRDWTKADLAQVQAIEQELHMVLRMSRRLENKIPIAYLDSDQEDFKTDAIICMIARIEDALDEITDFKVSHIAFK